MASIAERSMCGGSAVRFATWRAAIARISGPCSSAAMRRNCHTASASPIARWRARQSMPWRTWIGAGMVVWGLTSVDHSELTSKPSISSTAISVIRSQPGLPPVVSRSTMASGASSRNSGRGITALRPGAVADPQGGDDDRDGENREVRYEQLHRAVDIGIEHPKHAGNHDPNVHAERHVHGRAPLDGWVGLRQKGADAEDSADGSGEGGERSGLDIHPVALYRKISTICHPAKPRMRNHETTLIARTNDGRIRPRSRPAAAAWRVHHAAEPRNTPRTIQAAPA